MKDEIGDCSNMETDSENTDTSPFYKAIFVSEEDNIFIAREMKRLAHLATLKEEFSNYSCPVMHIADTNLNLKLIPQICTT